MKVGILGAMVEEIEPFVEVLENKKVTETAQNTFYEGRLNGHDVVLAYSKIGKVNSTLTVTLMIERFGAERILFSGVAGGINPGLRIGDLVVATQLVQHDVDITAFGHPFGFIPESGDFVDADPELIKIAQSVAEEKGIKLLTGVIATGDQFIADERKKNWIQETYRADALEMEGASVAYTAKCLEVPFFVLRAISDTADMDAGFSFEEFLKSSAKESAAFLLAMLDKMEKAA